MAIEIDDDRIEKQLPLWAGQLIYKLESARKGAEFQADRNARERDEARQQLLDHLNNTNGPADSDTFAERDQVHHDDEVTTALGLGAGAVVSFMNPAICTGNEGPSIQAQLVDGRVLISTDFGELALTVVPQPNGNTAIAVTIADRP